MLLTELTYGLACGIILDTAEIDSVIFVERFHL